MTYESYTPSGDTNEVSDDGSIATTFCRFEVVENEQALFTGFADGSSLENMLTAISDRTNMHTSQQHFDAEKLAVVCIVVSANGTVARYYDTKDDLTREFMIDISAGSQPKYRILGQVALGHDSILGLSDGEFVIAGYSQHREPASTPRSSVDVDKPKPLHGMYVSMFEAVRAYDAGEFPL